jgi:hypothetical protein
MSRIITTEIVKQKLNEFNEQLIDSNWQYENAWAKFLVKCINGHVRQICWHDFNEGHRCLKCITDKQKIKNDVIRNIIIKHNGRLDDNFVYNNSKSKFFVTCKCGHRWQTCWSIVKSHWCPMCANIENTIRRNDNITKKRLLKINELKTYLVVKGGIINNETQYISDIKIKKLRLTCKNSHHWSASFGTIRHGHWCPYCKDYRGEDQFRQTIEKIFNKPFPSKLPLWLRETGRRRSFELDGFNEQLKVAFEYQGQQHYQLCFFNKRSVDRLKNQQHKDIVKQQLCDKHNVLLIIVPYYMPKEQWKNEINTKYLEFSRRLSYE